MKSMLDLLTIPGLDGGKRLEKLRKESQARMERTERHLREQRLRNALMARRRRERQDKGKGE